jgi:hypothetical protein
MDALKKSIAGETSAKGKKPRKISSSQNEILLPIAGKCDTAQEKATKPERAMGRRSVG